MTEKRMKVTPEEEAILLGLRHERAVYNSALTDSIEAITLIETKDLESKQKIFKAILELRK